MIDEALVQRLIASQFPKWKDLPISPVAVSGWDNRTYHLGKTMLVRLPSSEDYSNQVEKEQTWLPLLAPFLPLKIPVPLAMGHPDFSYPWKWSIYEWVEGENASSSNILNMDEFATKLAKFLMALQSCDTANGPKAGPHNFYRGGKLFHYDGETRAAIKLLQGKINVEAATKIWDEALKTTWKKPPVWVHGDISAGNLLVQNGQLSAVIDFGQLAIGDPACDLSITWTFFNGESRETFRKMLPFDSGTWSRAKGWTLWKALVVAAGFTNPNNSESAKCWQIINEILGKDLD